MSPGGSRSQSPAASAAHPENVGADSRSRERERRRQSPAPLRLRSRITRFVRLDQTPATFFSADRSIRASLRQLVRRGRLASSSLGENLLHRSHDLLGLEWFYHDQ